MEPVLAPLPERYNFAAAVLDSNRVRGGKPAYIDDVGVTTYAALALRVRKLATVLVEQGIRPEERILVVMHDTVDLPTVFLGALYAGVVPVLVNTLLPASDYAYMLAHSSARLIVASAGLLDKIKAALAELGEPIPVLISSVAAAPAVSGSVDVFLHDLDRLVRDAEPQSAARATYAEDIAFWLYSSGSTGRPKGTVHSHENLHYTAELYAKPVLGMRESDVVFSAAKLFFAYGLGNSLTFPLSVGATTVLMAERPTPDSVFERLVRNRPTLFAGVPTLYLSMLASPNLPPRSSVAMRVCASAGETLPERVGVEWKRHFDCDILDGLGSTEMLHIYLSNRPGEVAYGTTGVPVPGYEIELRDETGALVPEGTTGDLYVKGPSAALMYWRDRHKSRTTFLGRWMKTGDRFHTLPGGQYVYAGRSDDLLKVSGQYVAPVEVELVLQKHQAVLEAAVVGRPDASGLTRMFAFVVLRQGHVGDDALVSELQAFVKAHLAPHKYPREVVFVAELPKTATGKIQRFKLRD